MSEDYEDPYHLRTLWMVFIPKNQPEVMTQTHAGLRQFGYVLHERIERQLLLADG